MQNFVAILFVLALVALGTQMAIQYRPQPKPVSVSHCVIPLGGCKPPNRLAETADFRVI